MSLYRGVQTGGDPEHVFVQAAVVCFDRLALLLPGSAGSGKSTLVQHLVDLGALCYSDVHAVLDAAGRVLPDPTDRVLVGLGPRRVGFVVACSYTGTWQMEEGDPEQAWRALLDNSVAGTSVSLRVRTTLQQACESVKFLHGTRGEASDAAPRILRWMRGSPG